jgi:endo-1,4-beta-xylanase
VLELLDRLLDQNVPVDALGVQAHLDASVFDGFDPAGYRRFLSDVADRGLKIFITEMDVLDDTLPAAAGPRDRAVADIYRRYLDAALEEPEVVSLMTFGLSDRYTWLQEDFPRDDGAPRRPLPFDDKLKPKPVLGALQGALEQTPPRNAFAVPPRC